MEDELQKTKSATQRLADSANKPDFDKILRQRQQSAKQTIAAAKELGAIRSAETQARVQQQTNAALALQATTGGRAGTRGQAEEQRFGQFMASEIRKEDAQTQAEIAQAQQNAGDGGVGSNGDINLHGGRGEEHSAQSTQDQSGGGHGGSSYWGGGGRTASPWTTTNATAGEAFGSGGGGGVHDNRAGAVGADGICVVEEYK